MRPEVLRAGIAEEARQVLLQHQAAPGDGLHRVRQGQLRVPDVPQTVQDFQHHEETLEVRVREASVHRMSHSELRLQG